MSIFLFSDHETELKIAKSRVRELELTIYTQREEVLLFSVLEMGSKDGQIPQD